MTDSADHKLPEDLQARLDEAQVAQAEAAANSAAIKASKDAADAYAAQIAALVPDLSKVKDSTLDVKDGTALFGARLTYRALARAAEKVAKHVTAHTADLAVLVTTETDLASADASYTDVKTGLDQLAAAAGALLVPDLLSLPFDEEVLTQGAPRTAWTSKMFLAPIAAVGTAVASALPSVLSLLSAQRSVTTGAANPNDLAAAGAVAGALLKDIPGA